MTWVFYSTYIFYVGHLKHLLVFCNHTAMQCNFTSDHCKIYTVCKICIPILGGLRIQYIFHTVYILQLSLVKLHCIAVKC